jgi:pantetheine-phosphate adenylyltransferase
MRKVLIPFSGDPIHNGHVAFIERAAAEYAEVVVGFGENPGKAPTFSLRERVDMAKHALAHLPNVRITSFSGMMVDYACEQQIQLVLKGVRNATDLEYETQIARIGESQQLGVETRFILANSGIEHISSSSVKAVAKACGLIHNFVSLYAKQRLEARLNGQYFFGITGIPAAGKSYVGRKLEEYGRSMGFPVYNIELDAIGHDILGTLQEPLYQVTRDKIVETFGADVRNADGSINRSKLGDIVFDNYDKLAKLNAIMALPMRLRLRRAIFGKRGLFLINGALLAEADFLRVCNNNVILVEVNQTLQQQRLRDRGLSPHQIERRQTSQFDATKKREAINRARTESQHGQLWTIITDVLSIPLLFTQIIECLDIYGELRYAAWWNRCNKTGLGTYEHEYTKLVQAYNAPTRHYHTIQHIVALLHEYSKFSNQLSSPDGVLGGLFYHDFLDTEESSAEYVRKLMVSLTGDQGQKLSEVAHKCVLATQHFNSARDVQAFTNDERFLADMDLSILSKSREEVDEYNAGIREEYRHVDEKTYREARIKILDTLLKRAEQNELYLTPNYANRYTDRAIINLMRLLKQEAR